MNPIQAMTRTSPYRSRYAAATCTALGWSIVIALVATVVRFRSIVLAMIESSFQRFRVELADKGKVAYGTEIFISCDAESVDVEKTHSILLMGRRMSQTPGLAQWAVQGNSYVSPLPIYISWMRQGGKGCRVGESSDQIL